MADHDPYSDLAAERAVLGAVLLDNSRLALVRGIVGAEDFHDPRHATVWESVCAVADAGDPVDVVTLAADLRARSKLNSVGGAQFIAELYDTIPTVAHIESHAHIVARLAGRRAMLHAAKSAAECAANGDDAKAAEHLRAAYTAVDDRRRGVVFRSLGEGVEGAFAAMESRAESQFTTDPAVRSTGLDGLDAMMAGGLRGGQKVIVAARPSVGKSALALGMALTAARWSVDRFGPWPRGQPVLFFSLEMPHGELVDRALAMESGVSAERVRRGEVSEDDLVALTRAGQSLHPLPLFTCDDAGITLRQIAAECRRWHTKHGGLAAVVIDYLQLVRHPLKGRSREQEIAEISREGKLIAKSLNTPVISLSQLNRTSEKGTTPQRPGLADLRESGSLEQDADVVLLLYREEQALKGRGAAIPVEAQGAAEIIIAKQRNGPTGTVPARFEGATYRFTAPRAEGAIPPSAYDNLDPRERWDDFDP